MKVPVDYLQDYKEAFGSSCEYISAWNPSESGDDTKPVTPCDAQSLFRHCIIQSLIVCDNIINVTILADGSKMLAGTRYLASLDTA